MTAMMTKPGIFDLKMMKIEMIPSNDVKSGRIQPSSASLFDNVQPRKRMKMKLKRFQMLTCQKRHRSFSSPTRLHLAQLTHAMWPPLASHIQAKAQKQMPSVSCCSFFGKKTLEKHKWRQFNRTVLNLDEKSNNFRQC